MRDAAGFRNVLAHQSGDEIDHDLVFRHLQTELDVFVSFLTEVRAALEDPAND